MTTKIHFSLFFFSFLISSANAQQLIFQKTYGDSLNEEAFDLKKTFDGGYILTGTSNSSHPSITNPDVYLIKTDSVGNLQWKQTFGSIGVDIGQSVIQTSDSGYSILGLTIQPFLINSDFYYLKTDKNGNLLLSGYVGANGEYEYAYQIIQTNNGGLVMVGTTEAGLGGNTDFYFAKFSQSLTNQLSNAYGDSSSETITGITQSYDNGFVFTGGSGALGGNIRTCVVKVDTSGNIIWSKLYSASNHIIPIGIKQAPDSGFVIAGRTSSFGAGGLDFYLLKIDSAGNIVWSKTYGGAGDEYPYGFTQTNSGNFILTGVTTSFGFSNGSGYVIETDNNGDLIWSKAITTVGNLYSVVSNTDGSFAIAGSTNYYGAGNSDMLLIQADSTGNFGCNQTTVNSITTTVTTNSANTSLIISSGGMIGNAIADTASIGVATTICFGTGINELNENIGNLNVFPNPTKQLIYFELTHQETYEIEIFDVTGRNIFKQANSNGKIIIDCQLFPDGIYFIKATSMNAILTSKLIKQ